MIKNRKTVQWLWHLDTGTEVFWGMRIGNTLIGVLRRSQATEVLHSNGPFFFDMSHKPGDGA